MVQWAYPCNKLNKVSYNGDNSIMNKSNRDRNESVSFYGANSIMNKSIRDRNESVSFYGANSIMNKSIRGRNESVSFTSETGHNLNGSDQGYLRPKEDESLDLTMKKAGFNLATTYNSSSKKIVPIKRNFTSNFERKIKILDSEESIALYSSRSRRGQLSASSSNIQRKPWHAQINSPLEKRILSNVASLRSRIHKPTQGDERRSNKASHYCDMQQTKTAKDLSSREKVFEVVRHFTTIFEQLDRDRAARGGWKTADIGIDYLTRDILIKMRMQVNQKKIIGPVPGIKVGDKFQFKTVLNLIGLHFNMRSGIDYMDDGDLKLATSIVSAEGNGYSDRFDPNVMIYHGQGGNILSNDYKLIEDQKLVKGNLALANSMKAKTPVRVIRGKKRRDGRGKDYVYDGLYVVEDYWREKGRGGNIVFKFRLRRVRS